MKKIVFIVLVLAATFCASAQELYVGSYNLRNNRNDDAQNGNGWDVRSVFALGQMYFERPDIFGTQELYRDQIEDVLKAMPGYAFTGIGRDDGKEEGEYSAIFFNTTTLDLLDAGSFWLSEHPDQPGLGWDAVCPRICSWGKFRDKVNGDVFCFFNLHMDHIGVTARREGAKLVVSRMKEIAGDNPAILTGDFNVDQTNEIYEIFTLGGLIDSFEAAEYRFAPNGTFNAFDPNNHTTSRIDHVFVTPQFAIDRYGVLTNLYWLPTEAEGRRANDAPVEISVVEYTLRTPSDHYPVLVRLKPRK